MNFKNRKYFTLVELIIVIAIIGVLSVSAFTIVTKWLGKSRDSRRLGEINQISKGLQSYQIENGKYPMPDMNYITLTSGTNTIGYQGYVGSGVSRIIELNKITKDPMDEKYYTYTTNLSKYQLMAMLEGSGSVNLGYGGKEQGESRKEYAINVIAREGNDRGDPKIASQELISENGSQGQLIINSVYAATDYSKRYPYLVGDKLGVILANTGGNTNAPVQELYNSTTFTGINVPSIDTGAYTSYVDNTTILNGTGLLQIPIYTNQSVVTPTTQESGGGSSPTNSCANTAWVSNATYLTGTPTTTNQAWQNTNSSNPCYFSCNGGYSWDGSACVQYEISNSLRFDSSRSTYLSKTYNTNATNNKKGTINLWFKPTIINGTTDQTLLSAGVPNNESALHVYIAWESSQNGKLNIIDRGGWWALQTNISINDPSKFYNLNIWWDTIQGTDSFRFGGSIDGNNITWGIFNPPAQNTDMDWGKNGILNTIGNLGYNVSRYFNGYMSEVNFIDGQALGPDNFGQTVGGKRLPKVYTGTYGTNGFYLDFKDGSNLGKDVSGRTNNWTVNNHQVTDQMIDTPTNNFCTMNSSATQYYSPNFSNGNLRVSMPSSISPSNTMTANTTATFAVTTGSWYWEIKPNNGYFFAANAGIISTNVSNAGNNGNSAHFMFSQTSTQMRLKLNDSTVQTITVPTLTDGAIYGIAVNLDSHTIQFYLNGSLLGTPISIPAGSYYPKASIGSTSLYDFTFNFGQGGQSGLQWCSGAGGYFKYCPPAGYKALSSKNIGN